MASGGHNYSEVTATNFSGASSAANASVHGLLVSVSRVKRGCNSEYFNRYITDGGLKL